MSKRSLFLGSVTLVLLVLFALAGCSNPAASGPAGQRGPIVPPAAAIDAEALAELFNANLPVRITTGNGANASVFGVVPPGKVLEIAGSVNIGVNPGETLDVQGTLHILEGGELFQNTGVLLVDKAQSVRIDGFIYEELSLFPVTGGLARNVSFGPNGGVAITGHTAAYVNEYFDPSLGIARIKWDDAAPLSAANLTAFDKWVPGKTLILNGDCNIDTDAPPAVNTDVSAKGALIVAGTLDPDGTVTPVTATLVAGQTLTTNGIPVLIAETATLELGDALSTLVGAYKVKGVLSAGNFQTSVIPSGVDLTEGTLRASDTSSTPNINVFRFPNNTESGYGYVTIKRIDVTEYDVGISNTQGLIVDLITNNDPLGTPATTTLTLPNNVNTVVKRIDTSGAVLSIQGEQGDAASKAILKPDFIYGANGLTLVDPNILIDGLVKVDGNTTITATSLGPFGNLAPAQFAQLAKISGGIIDVGATAFPVSVPTVFNTVITTTGLVTFVADTTLNKGFAIGTAGWIIAAGAKLTVGPYGQVVSTGVNPVLTIGPGEYAAADGNFTITTGGAISTATAGATLTIGDTAAPAKLTFKGLPNISTTGTFTPAVGVTLRGDLGAIIVAPTTGTFTLGATAELNIGSGGVIALGTGSILGIGASGGVISGFSTAPATKTEAIGTIAGITYGNGITVDLTTNVGFDTTTSLITATGAANVFTGTATSGGIVTNSNL